MNRAKREGIAGTIIGFLILAAAACILLGLLSCTEDGPASADQLDRQDWERIAARAAAQTDSALGLAMETDDQLLEWYYIVTQEGDGTALDFANTVENEGLINGDDIGMIYRAWRNGRPIGDIARQYGVPVTLVPAMVLSMIELIQQTPPPPREEDE
ncbi:MAG: hypothetical protein OXH56_01890 [Gemmatimonadetes bacterium]|nr:hypothetical protein [Gemmatimonadota bacterium]